jgi:hypothetical protein
VWDAVLLFIRRHVTNPWTTRFDRRSVGYSFIGLLRAGNFKFDYKLSERATHRLPFFAFPLSLIPLLPPHATLFRARPDEKLSSLDRDGIIGRPALFMAFIFLEMATRDAVRRCPLFLFSPFFFFCFLIAFSFR